jgi:hypothetical protein
MGQSYLVVNLDKKEFLDPSKFGDGLKLLEFGLSEMGTMSGLAILLADGNNGGNGGDIKEDPVSGIVGHWAGDRVVIAGQYVTEDKFITKKSLTKGLRKPNTYYLAEKLFKDISYDVVFALMADDYVRQEMVKGNVDDIIMDFNAIHKQLTKNQKDMVLLVGHIKSNEGKAMLERFLRANKSHTTSS